MCGAQPVIRELKDLEGYCMPGTGHHPGSETDAHGDINVKELKARLDRGETPQIIDVREPNEYDICRIPGARLIPLAQLPQYVHELDPDREVILHCKSGGRSARAASFLRSRGFRRILAWIDQVDPTQRKY